MNEYLTDKLIKILHSYPRYKDIPNIEIIRITPTYSGLLVVFISSNRKYRKIINYDEINKTTIY